MSYSFTRRDDATGKEKRLLNFYTDQSFTVGAGGATTFTITGRTINSTDPIQVWRNGVEETESTDWNRNTGSNAIIFTYTVPQNAVVKVRTWFL